MPCIHHLDARKQTSRCIALPRTSGPQFSHSRTPVDRITPADRGRYRLSGIPFFLCSLARMVRPAIPHVVLPHSGARSRPRSSATPSPHMRWCTAEHMEKYTSRVSLVFLEDFFIEWHRARPQLRLTHLTIRRNICTEKTAVNRPGMYASFIVT